MVNLGSSAGDPDYNHNHEFGKGKPCYELDNYGDNELSYYSYRMEGAMKNVLFHMNRELREL